ncbi:hypothetical protein SAMN05192533_10148 [Mesobacillus persicus]|uniref:Uncharacterized protein n=1 Tax=Mesobacillus persicus TaxID=930146 RepID=A0A1H7VPJ3_9BACI|nr:hypothetical protein SAMN05192533_10148 [Mesobacillus persicus]
MIENRSPLQGIISTIGILHYEYSGKQCDLTKK